MEALDEHPAEVRPEPVDLMLYFRIVAQRRWVVLAFAAVVVISVAFYTLRQPKIYQATSSLIIDTSAPKYLDNNQVQEVVESGTGTYWYNKEHYETQYKVIVSRAVSKRVVEKLGLESDLSFLGLDKIKDPAALRASLSQADAIAVLQSKIKVQPVRDSRLVYVVIEDLDPDRAALLSNEITQAYIAENMALKLRTTEGASEWLEERLRDLEQRSKTSELAVYDFKKGADMLTTSLEDRQSMVSQRLNATNLALTDVKTKIAGLKARVDAIKKLRSSSSEEEVHWAEALSATGDNLLIQQLKVRYAAQKAECAELKERYLGGHPKLVACTDKLNSSKQDLAHEMTNIVRGAETDLSEATERERNLSALLEAAKTEGFEVNKKQIEFDRLKRDADNNQRLYDLVLKRLKDIELSGLLRTSNVRILDPARPSKIPIKPNVQLALLLGLFLGLLGGVGLAFTLEYLDDTVSNQSEVEAKLGLSFLGFMPTIPASLAPDSVSRDLHVHRDPKSSAAECCRAIRTNLLFMSPDKPFKTMLVSSSGPQEGKSTSVMTLGITMAQSGNRVLIIDTDMRRPRLHKAFGVPNDVGVSSLVVGDGSLDLAIKNTEVPGVFLLPCGPIPPNPSELLHTEAFRNLLKTAGQRFDRVILDSPPIGALTDAVILATQVDGVVMVLKAGKTSREMVKRAARALSDVNAKVFGVVLNQINLEDPKYGDYFYAYRQYGYPYQEKNGGVSS